MVFEAINAAFNCRCLNCLLLSVDNYYIVNIRIRQIYYFVWSYYGKYPFLNPVECCMLARHLVSTHQSPSVKINIRNKIPLHGIPFLVYGQNESRHKVYRRYCIIFLHFMTIFNAAMDATPFSVEKLIMN